MAAGKLNIVIDKGATYRRTLYYKDSTKNPIDITNYTARMQIKSSARSSTNILELTTANGRITLTGVEGKIELFISDTDTAAVTFLGNAVYDLELEDIGSGDVIKLVRGTVSFHEEITT